MFVGFSLKIDLTLWISNVLLLGKSILAWQCHIHRETLAASDFETRLTVAEEGGLGHQTSLKHQKKSPEAQLQEEGGKK